MKRARRSRQRFGLVWSTLAACCLAACGAQGPAPLAPEVAAFLERHRDPRTWEALDEERVAGWPRRARDPRTGIVFVLVPAGEFVMGGSEVQDRPRHLVRISRPFYLGETEVTVGQWRRHVAEHGGDPAVPLAGGEDDHPAGGISWLDAEAFCARYGYRLPTEAEWEYACRGGADGGEAYWTDPRALDEHAWSGANALGKARPVRTRKPNGFGLYDMLGSTWEWCADWFDGSYDVEDPSAPTVDPKGPEPAHPKNRCQRGGSWVTLPPPRPSDRACDEPHRRSDFFGFRVAQTLPS